MWIKLPIIPEHQCGKPQIENLVNAKPEIDTEILKIKVNIRQEQDDGDNYNFKIKFISSGKQSA